MTILSTAKEYIRQYPERLDKFIYEYEATETDFIDEELEKLENVLIDLDRIKTSTAPDVDMEFSFSGYPVISEVIKYIDALGDNGFKKFYFATKRKIQFLKDKKKTETEDVFARPEIKGEVKADYYEELKKYFIPEEQFKNYVYGLEFTQINFNGTQAQLAGIFKQINDNEDLAKQSWEKVAEYISQHFTYAGKTINKTTLLDYLTGKKRISDKNLIEIKI